MTVSVNMQYGSSYVRNYTVFWKKKKKKKAKQNKKKKNKIFKIYIKK